MLSDCADRGRRSIVLPKLIGALSAFCTLLFLFWALPVSAQTQKPLQEETKKILLVHSFNLTSLHHYNIATTFIQEMMSDEEFFYTFFHLDLNANALSSRSQDFQEKLDPFLEDLKSGLYEAVVSFGDQAKQLLEKNLDTINPGTVIFHAAISAPYAESIPERPQLRGSILTLKAGETLETALRLFPKRDKVALLTDTTPTGLYVTQELQSQAAQYLGLELNAFDIHKTMLKELTQRLIHANEETIVIFNAWGDSDISSVEVVRTAQFYTDFFVKWKIPVFVMKHSYLQHGILGGWMVLPDVAGSDAADCVKAMLRGKSSLSEFHQLPTQFVLHSGWFSELGGSSAAIPAGAILLHQMPGFWQTHKVEIIVTVFIVFLLFSFLLLVAFSRSRKHQRQAQKNAEHLNLTLKSIADAVIVSDQELRITIINSAAEVLLGWPNGSALGKPIDSVLRLYSPIRKSLIEITAPLRESLATGDSVLQQHQHSYLHSQDGKEYYVSYSVSPVRDASETVIGAVVVLRDVTLEHEQRVQLEKAFKDAQDAEKAMGNFLSTMSHEIRTPLNALIGFAELLQDSSITQEDARDYLAAIHFSSKALLMLINDILDLSKLEAGQMQMHPTRIRISTLFKEIGTIFHQKAREKNLRFLLETPPELPVLWLDNLRLRQILLNLISNAIKFTKHGGVYVNASYSGIPGGEGTFKLSVRDTGIGISKEYQKQIFIPFSQQTTSPEETTGTGLGLSISRKLALAMNGRLEMKSEENKGSTFTIILEGVKSEANSQSDNEWPQEHSTPIVDISLLSSEVLLVDDQALNLKVLDQMIKREGFSPLLASSAAEALEIIKNQKIDLLFTDLKMPGMDGDKLAREVRKLPGGEQVKIFIVTADVYVEDHYNLEAVDGILTKPVTHDKLKKLLKILSQNKRMVCGKFVNELGSSPILVDEMLDDF